MCADNVINHVRPFGLLFCWRSAPQNLLLLDQLLKNPQLELVWCCNELNAGYAADGYARARGLGCVITTFTVRFMLGGLQLQ